MFKTYFKLAYRNILKDKAYSVLNISGLAIGLASSILVLLWVQNELSYDKFHKNAGQIYRIAGVCHPMMVHFCDDTITSRCDAEDVDTECSCEISGSSAQSCEAK